MIKYIVERAKGKSKCKNCGRVIDRGEPVLVRRDTPANSSFNHTYKICEICVTGFTVMFKHIWDGLEVEELEKGEL